MKTIRITVVVAAFIAFTVDHLFAATAPKGLLIYCEPPSTYVEFCEYSSVDSGPAYTTVSRSDGKTLTFQNVKMTVVAYPAEDPKQNTLETANLNLGKIQELLQQYPQFKTQLQKAQEKWKNALASAKQLPSNDSKPEAIAMATPAVSDTTGNDLTTLSGKKYVGIAINRVEPDGLVVTTEAGIEKIPFTDLSKEIQTKYGYDATKAAQFQKAEAQAQESRLIGGIFTEDKHPFEAEITDPEKFFKDFIAIGHPRERDQFETAQEYEARLPKPPDLNQVYYFVADYQSNFSYDISTQQLTLVGGEFPSQEYKSYSDYKLNGKVPFKFHEKIDDKGDYEASNSFGAKAKVTKAYIFDWLVHFSPNTLNAHLVSKDKGEYVQTERLSLVFHIPRDQAKEAASHMVLVIGVKFVDPKRSADECISASEPTLDHPYELATFYKGIDADLVSVHVIDNSSKEELAKFTLQHGAQ